MTKQQVVIEFAIGSESVDSQLAALSGKVQASSVKMAESMVAANKAAAAEIIATWQKAEMARARETIVDRTALQDQLQAIEIVGNEKIAAAFVAIDKGAQKTITGLREQEALLRVAVAKAEQAAAIAEYEKYASERDAISAQITSAEERNAALRVAAAKAEAAASIAAYEKWQSAQAAMSAASLAKISIGQQIAAGAAATAGAVGIGESLIPANMAGGAAKLAKEAEYAERLAAAGIETVQGAKTISLGAKVWTESAVMAREFSRGNWSRMFGSATILIGAIGAVVGVALAVVAAADGIAELLGFNGIFRHIMDYRKATAGRDESEKDLKNKTETTASMGETRVAGLERAGIIDKKQAENFRNRLNAKDRTPESVGAAYAEIGKLMPKGGLDDLDSIAKSKGELSRLGDEEKENYRRGQTDEWNSKLHHELAREAELKMKANAADSEGAKYLAAKVEYEKELKAAGEFDVRIAKEKTEEAKKLADAAREQKKLVSEAQLHADEIGQRHDESFMPTLQELSHAGGKFGSMARKALQDEKKAKRDYTRGDVTGAHREIAARDKIYESLSGAGVVAESAEAREIKDLNKSLQIHFAGMPGNPKNPAWIKPSMK